MSLIKRIINYFKNKARRDQLNYQIVSVSNEIFFLEKLLRKEYLDDADLKAVEDELDTLVCHYHRYLEELEELK